MALPDQCEEELSFKLPFSHKNKPWDVENYVVSFLNKAKKRERQ